MADAVRFSEDRRGHVDKDPSLTADADGRVWVAWHSYRRETERILLRSFKGRRRGELLEVNDRPGRHFQPRVACGGNGRWIHSDCVAVQDRAAYEDGEMMEVIACWSDHLSLRRTHPSFALTRTQNLVNGVGYCDTCFHDERFVTDSCYPSRDIFDALLHEASA